MIALSLQIAGCYYTVTLDFYGSSDFHRLSVMVVYG